MDNHNQAIQKSGFAIASLVLGILAFIPLVGIMLGILAMIFGVIAKRQIKKLSQSGAGLALAGIILGAFGIFATLGYYGALYHFGFKAKGGPFKEAKVEATKQMLTQNAGALELYKKQYGNYPESLETAKQAGYTIFPIDFYQKSLQYTVQDSGQSYELRSAGKDELFGTEDDLLFPRSSDVSSTTSTVTVPAAAEEAGIPEEDRIQVVFPQGGEQLEVDKTYNIRWANYFGQEPLTIALQATTPNNEVSVTIIAPHVSASRMGSYTWIVTPESSENRYKIEVYPAGGRELVGRSSDFFNIVGKQPNSQVTILSPNGGEIFKIGETIKITWSSQSNSSIQVYLFNWTRRTTVGVDDVYAPEAVIAEAIGNQDFIEWKIPTYIKPGEYFVRVLCNFCLAESIDYSDKSFSIVPLR